VLKGSALKEGAETLKVAEQMIEKVSMEDVAGEPK
jgi:hypothetical protein